MAVSSEKIAVYNLADLKNTSDDAIPNYLNSLGLRQSHRLTDVRLALGYAAFAVAAACFLWDYKLGFESTKHYTAAAVAVYTLLNGALTLWIWHVERGVVYVGTTPAGETVTVASSTKKNVPVYNLSVTTTSSTKSGAGAPQTVKIARSFSEWFDAAGHFVAPPFQTMLATGVPAIGKLDKKRVAAAAGAPTSAGASAAAASPAETQGQYSQEMLDALAAASADGASSTGSTTGKKGGKRRKA
ncbi:uncharacterized protein E0L32_009724 [Thyridium curvatum]|uniref:Signal peptidase complex subunit 2 n=1 Tax=Thyridium curvatum TaxID=1093900 RepID=A0A507AQK4_9PEZI|nr:uncharacterized protein E0L32_009724 [Thyridium curvatum]TPX08784.1 hypothetical protein E0L32_009724 [Thyridium curvatum]